MFFVGTKEWRAGESSLLVCPRASSPPTSAAPGPPRRIAEARGVSRRSRERERERAPARSRWLGAARRRVFALCQRLWRGLIITVWSARFVKVIAENASPARRATREGRRGLYKEEKGEDLEEKECAREGGPPPSLKMKRTQSPERCRCARRRASNETPKRKKFLKKE